MNFIPTFYPKVKYLIIFARLLNSGLNHFREILNLTERLAEQGVAVYEHKWLCLCFGSWSLVAGTTRQHRYQFSWDGRDFFMSVSSCDHPSNGFPDRWTPITCDKIYQKGPTATYEYVVAFFQAL